MTTTQLEADSARADAAEAGLRLDEAEARLDAAATDLAAHADARTHLRRRVTKSELRVAARDLAEGVRGLIRVAPFTAALVAVAVGVSFGRRRSPRPPARRR